MRAYNFIFLKDPNGIIKKTGGFDEPIDNKTPLLVLLVSSGLVNRYGIREITKTQTSFKTLAWYKQSRFLNITGWLLVEHKFSWTSVSSRFGVF